MININDKLLSVVDEKEYWLLSHIAKRINANGGCWPSMGTILKDTGWKDERTVRKYYRSMEKKGVMTVNPRFGNDGKQLSNMYNVTTGLLGVYVDLSTFQGGGASDAGGRGASDGGQSINQLKNTYVEQSPTADKIPFKEIVEHLNQKTGSNYKYTSKATKAKISARWREGFRLDDFKKVIDCKVLAWQYDAKMNQYLRPETLFGTKFESYLNACKTQPEVNLVQDLIDTPLTTEQANQYLNYHQTMRDEYPRLYANVKMLKASEYFEFRPGSKRWEILRYKFTSNEIGKQIADTHKGIEKGLSIGRSYIDVYTELNSALRQKSC